VQESTVRRQAAPIFETVSGGNTKIAEYAAAALEGADPTAQAIAAQRIGDSFDTSLRGISPRMKTLQEVLGPTAIAATIPASKNDSRSSDNWTPNKALEAYLTGGNPSPALPNQSPANTAPQATVLSAAPGGSASAPVVSGISGKLGASPGVTSNISVPVNGADTAGNGRAVSDSGDSVKSNSVLTGKISNTGSTSAVATVGSGATLTRRAPTGGAAAKMNTLGVVETQNQLGPDFVSAPVTSGYQLQGPSVAPTKDSVQLQVLRNSKAISGNSYQRIRANYGNKKFREALDTGGIQIRLLDSESGKVTTTLGLQRPVNSPSRQPSSTDSAKSANKDSQKVIIFEDNGKRLERVVD
jgi:hypothetical protein